MVLPTPQWQTLGDCDAEAHIHKDNGRLYWNEVTHQYLGHPDSVMLEYESTLNWLGIRKNSVCAVIKDEDGNFYIDAQEALESIGLEFPLAEHLIFEPEPPLDNLNRVILVLE